MNARVPSPMAVHVNSALLPLATVILCGGTVIVGGSTAWKVQSMEVDRLVINLRSFIIMHV